MIKGMKRKFVGSLCMKVLKQIRKRKGLFALATLLDLLFFGVIVSIGSFVSSKIPQDQNVLLQYFGNTTNLLIFAILYPLAYYLVITLLYSLAKLVMLSMYESMRKPATIPFKRYWNFFGLNVGVYFSFMLVALAFFLILGLLFQKEFLAYVVLVVGPVAVFFLMAWVHIAHSAFIHGASRGLYRRGLSLAFRQIKRYGTFFLWDLAFVGAFYVVFNAVHLLLRYTLFSSEVLVARFSAPYTSVISVVSLVFLFLVFGFNRLYFLEANRQHVYS